MVTSNKSKNFAEKRAVNKKAGIYFRTPGERLAFMRKEAGFSLNRAAEASTISRAELSRLECDERRFDKSHAIALAGVYHVDYEDLLAIMDFDTTLKVNAITIGDVTQPVWRQFIKCLRFPSRRGELISAIEEEVISLNLSMPLSEDAFGIFVSRGTSNEYLPTAWLVIADPSARTVLGDLVINPDISTPAIVKLERNDYGELIGTVAGKEVTQYAAQERVQTFSKIVAVLPAPHLFMSGKFLANQYL